MERLRQCLPCTIEMFRGEGQFIDLNEPIFQLLGPQPMAYDQLGIIQERMGNHRSTMHHQYISDIRRTLSCDLN